MPEQLAEVNRTSTLGFIDKVATSYISITSVAEYQLLVIPHFLISKHSDKAWYLAVFVCGVFYMPTQNKNQIQEF